MPFISVNGLTLNISKLTQTQTIYLYIYIYILHTPYSTYDTSFMRTQCAIGQLSMLFCSYWPIEHVLLFLLANWLCSSEPHAHQLMHHGIFQLLPLSIIYCRSVFSLWNISALLFVLLSLLTVVERLTPTMPPEYLCLFNIQCKAQAE